MLKHYTASSHFIANRIRKKVLQSDGIQINIARYISIEVGSILFIKNFSTVYYRQFQAKL